MKKQNSIKLVSAIGLVACLTACKTASPPQPTSTPAVPQSIAPTKPGSIDTIQNQPPVTIADRTFEEGLNLYEQGKYSSAIKKFRAPALIKASPDLRVRALKYLAFSYCVTNKPRSCHNAFRDALQIDPNFNLLPSEEKHPIWGKIFLEVKAQQPKSPEPPASHLLPDLSASQVPPALPASHALPALPASQVPPASHMMPAQHTPPHAPPALPASAPSAVTQ